MIKQSTLYGHYEKVVDRESAYEMLRSARNRSSSDSSSPSLAVGRPGLLEARAAQERAARAMGTQVGREIIRGVLGSILTAATTRRRR